MEKGRGVSNIMKMGPSPWEIGFPGWAFGNATAMSNKIPRRKLLTFNGGGMDLKFHKNIK